jgi:hypothetical protein
MHTTATLYVLPTCARNPMLVRRIEAQTGRLVITNGRNAPRLINAPAMPSGGDYPFGGAAA